MNIKSNSIMISKKFKVGNTVIELNDSLTGQSEITDKYKIFKSSYPVFTIDIKNSNRFEIIKELKEFILKVYKKGVKNKFDLTAEETMIFYYIKNVTNTNESKDKKYNTLLITHDDSIITMKNILLKFDTNCNCFELKKNLELYSDIEYEKELTKFINICKKNKYDKFAIDITNLYLPYNYSKTISFIKYIESINGSILFILDRYDSAYDRFIKIFGEEYKDNVIDKFKFLYAENTLGLYKISEVLYS